MFKFFEIQLIKYNKLYQPGSPTFLHFNFFYINLIIYIYIYIQTLSNYHMAYPSDTHIIESFTCSITNFLPSHEITITSSDTHTIKNHLHDGHNLLPSHEITITSKIELASTDTY